MTTYKQLGSTKEYLAAWKKVTSTKPEEGYLVFQVGYESKIILPHKEGVALIECLRAAEHLDEPYGKTPEIKVLDRNKITIHRMAAEEYNNIKIAAILNLTYAEVVEAANARHESAGVPA